LLSYRGLDGPVIIFNLLDWTILNSWQWKVVCQFVNIVNSAILHKEKMQKKSKEFYPKQAMPGDPDLIFEDDRGYLSFFKSY
jgi:hypothetical protein